MNAPGANPFRMPTDEQVFLLRDEEKRRKAEEREQRKKQRVHEKMTTTAMRSAATRSDVTASLKQDDAKFNALTQHTMAPETMTLPTIDVREKDSMASYIQKKREMGLARMSLATKRQEIKKLDEEADRAEKKLRQQQDQLASTHEKFNNFLKHSSLEQDAAVKRADIETKAKQEKLVEIKKLTTQLNHLENERRKCKEQLDMCLGFKKFLDDVTKPNFIIDTLVMLRMEDERKVVEKKVTQKHQAAAAEKAKVDAIQAAQAAVAVGLDPNEAVPQPTEEELMLEDARIKAAIAEEVLQVCTELEVTIREEVENAPLDSVRAELDTFPMERVPMYFQEPSQILELFINVEEGNLFLIQNCQELEEELERVAMDFQAEETELKRNAMQRRNQMEAVAMKIRTAQSKLRALEDRLSKVNLVDANKSHVDESHTLDLEMDDGHKRRPNDPPPAASITQEELKLQIEERVKEIFKSFNHLADETNMDPLGMLTIIEMKLEEMRNFIKNPANGVEEHFVVGVVKQSDKERRRHARQLIMQRQTEERDERSRKALERAQAPVPKRIGKPVMWRSKPFDRKRKVQVLEKDPEEEDNKFFE